MERMKKAFEFRESHHLSQKHPEKLWYMRLLRGILIFAQGWPYRAKLYVPHTIYLVLLQVFSLSAQFVYFFNSMGNEDIVFVVHVYICTSMNTVTMSRQALVFTKNYVKLLKLFIDEQHLFYIRNETEFNKKIYIKVEKITHYFTVFVTIEMIICTIFFNAGPLIVNYHLGNLDVNNENRTFEYAIYMATPFDQKKNFVSYTVLSIFNVYCSSMCSTFFCLIDLIISIQIFNQWGHMKILVNNLETMPLPANLIYDETELKVVSAILKKSFAHYIKIYTFSRLMSETYKIPLFYYYVFHQISGFVLLVLCSSMEVEALIRYVPLTVIVHQQLIQLSYIFELIGTMSEKLSLAAYQIPWELMDVSNMRMAMLFLARTQKPVELRVMGSTSLGVYVMSGILRRSLSFYALLRTATTAA